MGKFFIIFILSFAVNLVWEKLHARLYFQYKKGEITNWILARASFWDAIYITLFAWWFFQSPFLTQNKWLIIPLGFMLSVFIEWYAMATKRWEYKQTMPIIPLIKVGITPVMQLGLLGYLVFLLVRV